MSLVRVINRILLLAAISSPKIPQKSKKIIKRQTKPQLKKERVLAEVVQILPPPPPPIWQTKKERKIFRLNRTTWSQSSMERECKFLQRSWMRIMIMINKN